MKYSIHNVKISLKLKIASLLILIVIGIMLTVTYIFTIRERNLRFQQVTMNMERLANNIATIRSVGTSDWEVYQNYIDNQLKLNPDIVYIAILDESNKLKAHSLNVGWVDINQQKQLSKNEQALIVQKLDQRQIAPESQMDLEVKSVNIIFGEQNLGMVRVGFSLIDLNDELKKDLFRNLALAIFFTVIAVILSYFMSYKILTPVEKLTSAMENISKGDFNQEVNIKSNDEIGDLAKTFNFMTKGLYEKKLIENFSRDLGFIIELEKILNLITYRLTKSLNSKQGFLFLKDRKTSKSFSLLDSYPLSPNNNLTFECDATLCDYFLKNRTPQSAGDILEQFQIAEKLKKLQVIDHSSLLIPIIIKEEVIGMFILAAPQKTKNYSVEQKKFLLTLIGQSAFAIENAILYEDLTEQERLKREFEIARNVQQSLLPQQNIKIKGLDIDNVCIPATEIGGDYFDFFQIDDSNIGIAIADVTGKGASAAFYMAVMKGIMLSLTPVITSPGKLLIELNRQLYGKVDKRIFVTMIYAIFDCRHRTVKFARAGHNSLLAWNHKDSKAVFHTPKGIGLGLDKGDVFNNSIVEQRLKYQTGDIFLFYTDGLSEAMNSEKEQFGEQKLVNLMTKYAHYNSSHIQKEIINAVKRHVQNSPQHDDMTIVTVKAT